jgi:hypothetical protein
MDCGALRRLLLFWLAVAAAFPASASAIDRPVPLPEGAAISDSLEYVGRVESPGLVEGKFDRVSAAASSSRPAGSASTP